MAGDRPGRAVLPAPLGMLSPAGLNPVAAAGLAAALDYAGDALAPHTLRAYAADWQHFVSWCAAAACDPLPAAPAAVAAYLAAIAPGYSRSALHRRLAAIGHQHRLRNLEWSSGHAAIRTTMKGIARRHPVRKRQAAALTSVELKQLIAVCPGDRTGLRDRALLLLGFAGALRRSELVAIDREHCRIAGNGLRLLLPRSKTDQAGEGVDLGIARGKRPETCPVRALEAWLEASDCRYGPVFRKVDRWGNIEHARLHADAVRSILRNRATLAKLTVPSLERLSPHGLRAGFVTEAYLAGARDEQVMDHTRHKDLKTMRGYVRRARLVTDSAVKLLDI